MALLYTSVKEVGFGFGPSGPAWNSESIPKLKGCPCCVSILPTGPSPTKSYKLVLSFSAIILLFCYKYKVKQNYYYF